MAKITLSALVNDVRGKVGPIVFSKWRGINNARALVTPGNPRTNKQLQARGFIYAVSKAWARQSESYKQSFKDAASGQSYSGFNLYTKRVRDFAPGFRDFFSTTSSAANSGDTVLSVVDVRPDAEPDSVDTLGFRLGQRIQVMGDDTIYSVTGVDDVAGELTVSPSLAVAAPSGAKVYTVGASAPDATAWTEPS